MRITIVFQCDPGFTSCSGCEGLVCAEDTDLDGWADQSVTCSKSGQDVSYSP